jgi:hypothetical protein
MYHCLLFSVKTILLYSAFICFLLTAPPVQAQWESDVRLTDNSAESYVSRGNAWSIAADANTIHAVWWDNRDGNYEIYTKRSTDGGTVWGADTRLTNNSAVSGSSSIRASGGIVHVVFNDNRTGMWPLYYKRSTDNGVSWSQDRVLTPSGNIGPTTIAVEGQVVQVAWSDARAGNDEIYSMHSTDAGVTWSADTRLTNNSALSEYPSIAVTGSQVHVVWWDTRDGNSEIYYKRSTDGGATWKPDTRLTNNSANSGSCSVGATGDVVHVVWDDDRDGNQEVYYKRSTDGGANWTDDIRLTNDQASQSTPNIVVSGSNVHVVWNDYRNGNFEIYYKVSTDGGVTWSEDTQLTNFPGTSWSPSIALSGTGLHVVWMDDRDGNSEVYYKRNPTGNPTTGIAERGEGTAAHFALLQNYPNPFNPATTISYSLPRTGAVSLKVYNVMGQEIAVLADGVHGAGDHTVTWNAEHVASGVYFCRLSAGGFVETKRLVLLR